MNYDVWTERTKLLLGNEKLEKLKNSHVLVVGLGGVGAVAAEMLCRAGITYLTIVDGDKFVPSNLNRQIPSLNSNLDRGKAEVLAERLQDINPEVKIERYGVFLEPNIIYGLFLEKKYDYVIDAIDTIAPKLELIRYCIEKKIPIISSMGAGGKLDPSKVRVADISRSYQCKLAQRIRKKLKKENRIYKGLRVVFSPEPVPKESIQIVGEKYKKSSAGTISYMPAIFGIYAASEVINAIIKR
ncbi:MAG: tRNA threonylcarbamoyladenosine dehydratase [Leptospiraceae bacterium]|nr:tRNA threonylcarbamoyladenosine dehydratase [Leptospiraceae bacterium]MCP5498764.1 tRNA threonylcarbamoyladenosine dehydratase [Leptospiraceae bacterium]